MRRYAYKKYYAWSEQLAYLAGLIASDGCLLRDNRHIALTSKDLEIIHYAQSIVGSYTKILIKQGQYDTTAYHFQFSNVALYDFFMMHGITPTKSKTITQVTVPDKYYADFLRGYFDGDGTVFGFRDKRWKNSYMYYCGYVSASKQLLLWLQVSNSRLFATTGGSVKQNTRAMTLTYAKADAQKLYEAMYTKKEGQYRLTRKYNKFTSFIAHDPYARINPDARMLELVDRPA